MSELPNLVFVFADQFRYQPVGFGGGPKAQTPYLDHLARESTNCINTTSSCPVCAPYRASLFTGKYASSTGMVINELRMNPNHVCIAHVLDRGGYIGKWHLWSNQYGNHYSSENSYIPPGPYRLGFDGFWAAYNFHHHYYGVYYHTTARRKSRSMATSRIFRPMWQSISSGRQPGPFALFLSYGTPHDPWDAENVPREFLDRLAGVEFPLPPNYEPQDDPHADHYAHLSAEDRASLSDWMRVYYAMTANLDWNAGRLLHALDEVGLSDNTIFVFTSDHGELFGAHGRRAKNIFYDEAVRVPFLIR